MLFRTSDRKDQSKFQCQGSRSETTLIYQTAILGVVNPTHQDSTRAAVWDLSGGWVCGWEGAQEFDRGLDPERFLLFTFSAAPTLRSKCRECAAMSPVFTPSVEQGCECFSRIRPPCHPRLHSQQPRRTQPKQPSFGNDLLSPFIPVFILSDLSLSPLFYLSHRGQTLFKQFVTFIGAILQSSKTARTPSQS